MFEFEWNCEGELDHCLPVYIKMRTESIAAERILLEVAVECPDDVINAFVARLELRCLDRAVELQKGCEAIAERFGLREAFFIEASLCGLKTGRTARKDGVGGEVICEVW